MITSRTPAGVPGRPTAAPPWALAVLLLLAFVAAPWAVYQWMELLVALEGGSVACAVGSAFDCTEVWFVPAAKTLQRWTGLPIAAWGLVWALAAFVAALRLALDRGSDRPLAPGVLGVRVVALGGALGVLAFLGISLAAGALCPTCLATYLVTLTYGGVAALGLKGPLLEGGPSGLTPPVLALVFGWGLLLWPGLSTPLEPTVPIAAEATTDDENGAAVRSGSPHDELAALVEGLPPRGKQALAEAVKALRGPARNPGVAPRRRIGPDRAPLLVTDFSDLRCGHCANLAETLHALRGRFGDRFAEDARYFPLSARCNPEIPEEMVDPTGVRCFAARALLCHEEAEGYPELRRQLFARQADLTKELVARTVEAVTGMPPPELERCVESSEVEAKLEADIAYAQRYDITGTPLVLLNGREIPGHPTLLYALILAGGDPDHPAFDGLPVR